VKADALQQLTDFERCLRDERRVSAHTTAGYSRDLRALVSFCDNCGIEEWAGLDIHAVRAYVADSHRRGLSGRSIQRRLSALRGFIRHLIKRGLLRSSVADEVRAPKTPHRLPHSLDVDRLQRLLAVAPDDWLGRRDLAMIELMYSSGLRLGELVALDLQHLQLREAEARVFGKGRKTRLVPVGRKAIAALQAWLAVRGGHCAEGEYALFINRLGTRISPRGVQQRLAHWAIRAGVDTHLHPHALRHSCATHMLESSGDLRAVQELLGHANLGTTQVYTHLDFQHLAQVYDQAHPRAKSVRKDS
jgi:integrase/recombinase XerC